MPSEPLFKPVPTELNFPAYERQILEFWKQNRIFEASLVQNGAEAPSFVFYEGPPTANGMPHNGHVLTRVMKDVFPRYRCMRGFRVLRKGGWDTHGLPVEIEVEKELGIHGKAAIENFGVEPFVRRCIDSVFRYTSEWERQTERIAFWVGLKDAYVTYHKEYVESVWWALSELYKKGLLYQGHKVVWWWAQGGTALSSGEVGEGYRTVDDPSVYVAFPLLNDPDTALLVWTTTPWTLPSNAYVAVKADVEYAVVRLKAPSDSVAAVPEKKTGGAEAKRARVAPTLVSSQLILALERVQELAHKLGVEIEVIRTMKGHELSGARYRPPFDWYSKDLIDAKVPLKAGGEEYLWWRVLTEDFVTLDSGTGLVHVAPAFGEDDHKAHLKQLGRYQPVEVELLCAILPDGTFKPGFGPYAGRWVKDCDKELTQELKDKEILVLAEQYRHEYPFCPRSDQDPLIQMARPAWFIRTTEKLNDALSNNEAVNWLPEHIKHGRFGDFLQNNVDWALSRERYWGTPLNVWICTKNPEHRATPSSVREIEALNPDAFQHWYASKAKDPSLSDHLMVHKPWVDEVVFPCPDCGAEMRRVPEVIDCWFDSGCMPFAQWGFPHQEGSLSRFNDAFPADFISEAIDQTRGWFYSLLMISTLVFDPKTQSRLGLSRVRPAPHPYKTCIVLGHVSDKEGRKEAKSRGNYTPPEIILDSVRLGFGVLVEAPGVRAEEGKVFVARDDLDGMDVREGAEIAAYRESDPQNRLTLKLFTGKNLPRRVAVMAESDRKKLGLEPIHSGLSTRPNQVPTSPDSQRVIVEDESTPAPGADAFRWFFYASSPPWSNTRHSLSNVRLEQKEFLVKLRNVYSFFTIYANIDGYDPRVHRGSSLSDRPLLDRWILSELTLTVRAVRQAMDEFMVYDAARRLVEFAESLSNWYVRRSRERFWAGGLAQDKENAYATLHECLLGMALLVAPFVPFSAEEMFQNLVVKPGVWPRMVAVNGVPHSAAHAAPPPASVHLARFPEPLAAAIDQGLSEEMRAVREVVSLGLRVRTNAKLKVRQPLSRADVVLNDGNLLRRVEMYAELIAEELNVHEVRFMFPGHEQGAVTFKLRPNFRTLGPRLGGKVQAIKTALAGMDGTALFAQLSLHKKLSLEVGGENYELSDEEIEVVCEAAPGFAAETGKVGVVVLHTALTEALLDEGFLREIQSRVQAQRKESKLEFTDRIELWLGGGERILRVAREGQSEIMKECLASALHIGEEPKAQYREFDLSGELLKVALSKV